MSNFGSNNMVRHLSAAVLSLVAGAVFVLGAVAPAEVKLSPATTFVA